MTIVAALVGLLLSSGLLLVASGLRPQERPASAPRRQSRLAAALAGTSERTRLIAGVAALAGLAVAAFTGWLLAIVLFPAAALGLPYLLSKPGSGNQVARLSAMEEWARSLAGVLHVGTGLEEAILATERSTPPLLRTEVGLLCARLRARYRTREALLLFGDDLDDPVGDLIVTNLLLGETRRGAGLASVLEGVARTVAQEVQGRREVEADRSKPRANAQMITIVTVIGIFGLFLVPQYRHAYFTPLGQLLFAIYLTVYVVDLLLMRRFAAGGNSPRFLDRAVP